jgi:circadian clock protein KaiC
MVSIAEDITDSGVATTGITGLDDVLGGGLPRNRLYLVQGDPGVGKTTMALQFLLEGVKRKEKVLYISLSETVDELKSVVESHDWTLDGIDLYELSAMEKYLSADAANTVFHAADVELNETSEALQKLIDRVNPVRAVFDSLSELRLLARDPLRYRRQILSLKQYFVGKGCTVLLLDDKTSAETDVQLQSICHGVILIEQQAMAYGIDRRRLRVQKLRGVAFRSGYHDLSMEKGGLNVYPRLIAAEHRHDIEEESLSTGIGELDRMLDGGLDRGVSTLLMGPAGSGKSTVAVGIAVAAAKRGEKAIFYSFEETPRTLYQRSRNLGIDLDPYIESGNFIVQHIDPAELTPGEFVHQVRNQIANGEVSVVIIDSLNGYLNAMPEERFLILQLHELLAFLGQKGVSTVLVVAQHGLMGSNISSAFDVSYLADTVLVFRIFENCGRLHQALSVSKRRAGRHDRSIREILFQSEAGVALGPPLENLRGVFSGIPVPASPNGESTAGE